MLAAVGLGRSESIIPASFPAGSSNGSRLRARLINRPELALADEPTGNLDTRTSVEIMGMFQRLNESGITIVMVTHETDIAAYAGRNIVMRDGIVQSDRPVTRRLSAETELKKAEVQP